jgi:hypothetical protein
MWATKFTHTHTPINKKHNQTSYILALCFQIPNRRPLWKNGSKHCAKLIGFQLPRGRNFHSLGYQIFKICHSYETYSRCLHAADKTRTHAAVPIILHSRHPTSIVTWRAVSPERYAEPSSSPFMEITLLYHVNTTVFTTDQHTNIHKWHDIW